MAILFMDSFDHYANSQMTRKWTSHAQGNGSPTPGIQGGGRRVNCFGITRGGSAEAQFPTSSATATFGVAVDWGSFGGSLPAPMFGFTDASTDQFGVYQSGGKLYVCRGATYVAGPGPTTLSTATWYYIELKVNFAASGSYELRINGVTELSGSGVDTTNTANNTCNGFRVVGVAGGIDTGYYFDDLYVLDDTGSDNVTFLGDVAVEAIFPNGNGTTSNLVGSDANSTDNYLLVDDTTSPDDDTTYVESSVVGDMDEYAFGSLVAANGIIHAIHVIATAKKDDAGARGLKTRIREGGTSTDSADHNLTTSYYCHRDIVTLNPRTSAKFTISDINGAEFGVKVGS